MKLTQQEIIQFQKKIYNYFNTFGRTFAWRETDNPYYIFVSEVMLQQTQTKRVEKKYREFIATFPDFASLAKARLHEVLRVWQGLGYNRRAKFLQQSAQIIVFQHDGKIPNDVKKLQKLPGIGAATAASIAAFAFNLPTIFVETNIRAVFIHLFLNDKQNISDTELLSLASQTIDRTSPRIWYYALTDYGAMLKLNGINPIAQSKMYNKQSPFAGSDRQIRGAIIKCLLQNKKSNVKQLCDMLEKSLNAKPDRIKTIIETLVNEKLVTKQLVGKKSFYSLES